ncbi:MAG TPA: AMP-binding protein [Nitrospirales bacterium]|nr:AMP-binding protein [Nitrospirales bacterium]
MQAPLIDPTHLPDTIPEAFFALSAIAADHVVMQIKEGEVYRQQTYGEVSKLVRGLASGLHEHGLHPGHRVAIVAENCPEWVIAHLGILTVGATAVPLDIQMPQEQLLSFLTTSNSRFVFVSSKTVDLIRDLPATITVVNMDSLTESHHLSMKDLMDQGQEKPSVDLRVNPDDVASLLYTSGTTKKPKGVLLTHRNFMANAKDIIGKDLAGPEDNFLVMLPLHHAYPFMIAYLVPILLGARMTFLSSLKGPDLVQCIHETGITIAVGVPQIFTMIRRSIFEELDRRPGLVRWIIRLLLSLSDFVRTHTRWNPGRRFFAPVHRRFGPSLHLLCSGGAKLDPQISKDLGNLGFTVREGYGLTETAPVVAFSSLSRLKPGSVGPPLASVEVRIDQPNESGIGEVVVRGPNVMKGYDQAPAETAEAIRDGWFHTGDLGYLDSDGYLFLTGRIKELIVTPGGKNILPEELEEAYKQNPAITELCILGLPRAGGEGEHLHAVVVPNFDYLREHKIHDSATYIKDALNSVAATLPPYKRISGVTFIKDPLPRTRLGKIQRHLVLAMTQTKQTAVEPAPEQEPETDQEIRETTIGQAVIQTLNRLISADRALRLDDHLDLDLGFDSLKRVEFQAALESRLGPVPETFMGEIVTVRDVITKLMALQQIPAAQTETTSSWHQIFETPLPPALTNTVLAPLSRGNKIIGQIGMAIVGSFSRIVFPLTVKGLTHLPKEGPFILAANHLSFIDPFIILGTVPPSTFSQLYTLGWEPFFRSPFRRWVARVGHVIPVGPETPMVTVLKASVALLRKGKSLLIFPEGERSLDGRLLPFKKGLGVLACELHIPIIPVKIDGSFEVWPPDAKTPKRHPITLTFGQSLCITPSMVETWTTRGEDPHLRATTQIRDAVASL